MLKNNATKPMDLYDDGAMDEPVQAHRHEESDNLHDSGSISKPTKRAKLMIKPTTPIAKLGMKVWMESTEVVPTDSGMANDIPSGNDPTEHTTSRFMRLPYRQLLAAVVSPTLVLFLATGKSNTRASFLSETFTEHNS